MMAKIVQLETMSLQHKSRIFEKCGMRRLFAEAMLAFPHKAPAMEFPRAGIRPRGENIIVNFENSNSRSITSFPCSIFNRASY